MADDSAEVKIALVADDAAKKVTDDLQKSLEATNAAVEKTNKALAETGKKGGLSLSDLVKGNVLAQKATESLGGAAAALAGPYGVALEGVDLLKEATEGAYELTKKLGEAALEAANASLKEEQGMAGTFALLDKGKHDFAEYRNYAEGVHEEMEQIGIKAGVSGQKMSEMYNAIIDRGSVSSEKAKELAGNMALVGRLVRGGPDSLANGFAMMEMGMVRAKNPIVQLIAATQTLHGNAKNVAQQMMHMTPAKQMEIAQKAIEKQAEIMKKSGALGQMENLDTLKTSFEGIREDIIKGVGKPMLDELIPKLVLLKDFLIKHGEEIGDVATRIGNQLGSMIDYVSDAVGGIYDSVHQNWDEIERVFHATFDEWRDAWNFGASSSDEIQAKFKTITDDLIHAFQEGMKWTKAAAEVAMDMKDLASGHTAGTTQAKVAQEAMQLNVSKVSGSGKGDTAAFEESARVYRAKAEDAGQNMKLVDFELAAARTNFNKHEQIAETRRQMAQGGQWDQLSASLDKGATGIHDSREVQRQAAIKFTAEMALGSEEMRKAILNGELHISDGMQSFIKMLSDASPELARKLKEVKRSEQDFKGTAAQAIFNNNTFNIHQDFKDDPDRMMIAFRQDIVKSAVNRRSSRLGTTFGL